MLTDAAKKIESLKFDESKVEPELEFAIRKYLKPFDGLDCFQVAIYGPGFEAVRNLNTDDLMGIRDWINAVLAALEAKDS
jgi:hypothetical protein